MLKRYYSIEEAAEFLTSEHGQKITHKDVLTLARHGDIRLCTWYEGILELCSDFEDAAHSSPSIEDTYSFKGYIQISKDVITPNGGKVSYSPVDSIEVITYDGPPIAGVEFPYGFGFITTNCDNAVIPAKDLLNLRPQKVDSKKPLTTNERNSFLTIIGLMAKDGYGNDLSKPYELAKEIQAAAEMLGIKISDDTIANKLKEAKKVFDEKSS